MIPERSLSLEKQSQESSLSRSSYARTRKRATRRPLKVKILITGLKDREHLETGSLLRYEIGYMPTASSRTTWAATASRRRPPRCKEKCPARAARPTWASVSLARHASTLRYQSVRAAALRVCDDLLHGQRLL